MADSQITQIAEINQMYLTDVFTYLTYLIQKGDMEQTEDEFQENLRKAKKGRK